MQARCSFIPSLLFCLTACGGDPDGGTKSVVLQGDVREMTPGLDVGSSPPVAGASVCVFGDGTQCTTTDENGAFTLEATFEGEVILEYAKAGYQPILRPLNLDAVQGSLVAMPLVHEITMDALATLLDTAYPMENWGLVNVAIYEVGTQEQVAIPGITLAIDTDGGAYYFGEDGLPSRELSETTAAGWGGFVEVPPGDATVTLTGLPVDCTVLYGTPVSGTRVRVPVVGGRISEVHLECPSSSL